MATKLFLNSQELGEAQDLLLPPTSVPAGNEEEHKSFRNQKFSLWLQQRMEARIKSSFDWHESDPIILGSWARNELCPKSDIDVLFCGSESATRKIVDELNSKGIKLRYRMPLDNSDWTKGVEPFDVLALIDAKGLTEAGSQKLKDQQNQIRSQWRKTRSSILKAMILERLARAKRYDSIANFLEPNIKYGAGGLRDLQQGLTVLNLFPENLPINGRYEQVLRYYRDFFLTIRQKLHLLGGGDILLAHHQEEIAKWFGFKNKTEFMGQVELGLSRVSFYSDWMLEKVKSAPSRNQQRQKIKISSTIDSLKALKKYPDVLMQYFVRQDLDRIFANKNKLSGRKLSTFFNIKLGENFFNSLFRSRIIDRIIPHMRAVFGLVQHDQYHRYSVDAHTLQFLKIICRSYLKPKTLPGLEKFIKNLKAKDWQILLWASIYHDIGKGSGKPHEIYGAELVKKDFKQWKLPNTLTNEVAWIVENHLVISQFAFRQNLRSPQTWQKLNALGIFGDRLKRLAVFTGMDILATNAEAWNSWKANLIGDLVETMSGEQTSSYLSFLQKTSKKKKIPAELIDGLDPGLTSAVPHGAIINDFLSLIKTSGDLKASVIKKGKNSVWLRFHFRLDRPGIFYEIVERLYSLGFSIQHAFVQTYADYGAYDWFEIKTSQSANLIQKLLSQNYKPKALTDIKFDSVEIVSHDPKETVISFRGLDQSGILLSAAQKLTKCGLTIRWARVLTWGRQIDDVFGVYDPQQREADTLLNSLRSS